MMRLLGVGKMILERLHNYAGKIQFLMVAYLFFRDPTVTWAWWYLPVGIVGVLVLAYVDYRWIFPAEADACLNRSPTMREMARKVREGT